MKKITLLCIAILSTYTVFSQTNVVLNINHKLASTPFTFNSNTANNQNNTFQFTRLDYYISDITLTYDGGKDTTLSDLYIIVKAGKTLVEDLGSLNVTNLESIKFGIGVDGAANHTDPSVRPASHALSFQLPSMHWGWTAGYRFAALEGLSGANMSQIWELHALGDGNFGHATVTTNGTMKNGDLIIALDANYERIFDGITVDANLNYHGEGSTAGPALRNFQSNVFTEGISTIGLSENTALNFDFSLAPNPSNAVSTVILNRADMVNSIIRVFSISGQLMHKKQLTGARTYELPTLENGIYLVQVTSANGTSATHKLLVQ